MQCLPYNKWTVSRPLFLRLVSFHSLHNEGFGGGGVFPAFDFRLLLFEDLVRLKEESNFGFQMVRDVRQVGNVFEAWVVFCDRENFFILSFIVTHHENTDGAHINRDAWVQRVCNKHENIERVAVSAECFRKETVVAGIEHWSKEDSVEFHDFLLFVEFVFVLATARNFDECLADFRGFGADREFHRGIKYFEFENENTISETADVVKVTGMPHNGGMSRVISPTQATERQVRAQGFVAVAGVDEAGAGALAGPVVAGAVVWRDGVSGSGIRDSKTLSLPARERLYETIVQQSAAWAAGVATVEEIAELGIRPANLLAMRRAVEALQPKADFVLVDAWTIPGLTTPQKGIIRADQKILCVAAASIIAKVTRDRMMTTLHEAFPQYGFNIHKGYGTSKHRAAIATHGPCPHHRLAWKLT